MRKIKLTVLMLGLSLSLIIAAQPQISNTLGTELQSLFNFGQKTTDLNSGITGLGSYTNPGYQGQAKATFDRNLQSQLLSTTVEKVDNGLGQRSLVSTAVANNTYFDFETGVSSSEPFSTADFYYSNTGGACPFISQGTTGAEVLIKASFSTVDYNTYGSDSLAPLSCASQSTFLFDEAHSPYLYYNTSYQLSQFYSMVTDSGYTASVLTSGKLTSALLSTTRVLVIYVPQMDYTPDEISAIGAFVANGGSLLMISDNGNFATIPNTILAQFGYQISHSDLASSMFYEGTTSHIYFNQSTYFASHALTANVQGLFFADANTLNKEPADGIDIVHTGFDDAYHWINGTNANGVAVISAEEATAYHGKILVVPDVNIWDNFYMAKFNNSVFVQNAIDWFAAKAQVQPPTKRPADQVKEVAKSASTIGNDSVLLWRTAEGNLVRSQVEFIGSDLYITYDSLYYISIDGNTDLLREASLNDWSGTGTAADPIVISGYNLAYDNIGAFSMTNTDLYVVFDNNYFDGLGGSVSGLALNNTQNVVISNNNITGYTHGVLIENSSGISLDNNDIFQNSLQGVLVFNSNDVSATYNDVANNQASGFTAYMSDSVDVINNTFESNAILVSNDPTVYSAEITFVQSQGYVYGNTLTKGFGYGILVVGTSETAENTLVLENNDITYEGLDGIAVISSDALRIFSNTVDNNYGAGVSVSSSTNVVITDNTITNNGQDGLYWIHSWYGFILENTITGNSNLPLLYAKTGKLSVNVYSGMFMDPSYYNVIDGNTVTNNGNGIEIQDSGFNNITSNNVSLNAFTGLAIYNSKSNRFISNDVIGNSNPNTLATFLQFTKPGSLNVNVYSGMFMDPSENNTIIDNNIDSNYGYGLWLQASDFNNFDSNSMSQNGQNGVFVEDSNYNQITNNQISQNSNPSLQYALLQTLKPGSLQVNVYSGMFMDPSMNNLVAGNTFDNNYGDGVQLSASDNNTFDQNAITNNALNGFSVLNSNNNQITNNHINGNANPNALSTLLSYGKPNGFTVNVYSGMFMDPSENNTVYGNDISSNYGSGAVFQESNKNTFSTNTLTGNGGDGIGVYDSNDNTFSNNYVSANSNPALQLALMNVLNNFKPGSLQVNVYSGMFMDPSSGNNVTGNTFDKNPGNGIWLQESSSNTLDGNTITNSGEHGVFFQNSSYNTIQNNEIAYSGNTTVLGMFLSYAKPTSLQVNVYSGMFMDPSKGNKILNNNIHNNNGYGVNLQDSDGNSLAGNQLSYNHNEGFFAQNSNELSLTENAFTYNGNYGTHFDSSSKNSNVDHNDYIGNGANIKNIEAYDDGGNYYSGNFFIDENPNHPYLIAGSAHSKDYNVSLTPNTNLGSLSFPPIEVRTFITARSFNVRSEGRYLSAWVYFPDSYSAYLVNKSSLTVEWNGNSYPVLRAGNWGSHWLYLKFDRHSLANDVYNYLVQNKLSSAKIDLTIQGSFNGGFLQFYGTDSIYAFNYHHDGHGHHRDR